ncbi:GntG family PLP-dependent aldolase [Salinifilum aidingensis]
MTKPIPIDLRSDAVTRPDERLSAAMARAEVGDDVLDHDPTMRVLEERVAQLLGTAAALWVPSGTMGNLIALSLQLSRGDRFLAPRAAHVLSHERGTAAWLAGGMPEPLDWDAGPGRPSAQAVRSHLTATADDTLRTRLLCLEDTHAGAGGALVPPHEHARLTATARNSGLRVHLDGSRLWHAAVALGLPPAALAVGVDTVQVGLNKGLGAPAGAVLAGSAEFTAEARRMRTMLGGGLRQSGVLAAAGLVALERRGDLATDHDNADRLAAGLRELGWEVTPPQTNIVLAAVPDPPRTLQRLTRAGVLAAPAGRDLCFITHRDVSTADIDEALLRIKREQG